jgi:hypothetical protein
MLSSLQKVYDSRLTGGNTLAVARRPVILAPILNGEGDIRQYN